MIQEVEVLKEGVDNERLEKIREENLWFKTIINKIGTRQGTYVSLLINNELIWHVEVVEKGHRKFSYIDIPNIPKLIDDINIVVETNSGETMKGLYTKLPQHPNLSVAIIGKVHTFAD